MLPGQGGAGRARSQTSSAAPVLGKCLQSCAGETNGGEPGAFAQKGAGVGGGRGHSLELIWLPPPTHPPSSSRRSSLLLPRYRPQNPLGRKAGCCGPAGLRARESGTEAWLLHKGDPGTAAAFAQMCPSPPLSPQSLLGTRDRAARGWEPWGAEGSGAGGRGLAAVTVQVGA